MKITLNNTKSDVIENDAVGITNQLTKSFVLVCLYKSQTYLITHDLRTNMKFRSHEQTEFLARSSLYSTGRKNLERWIC